MVSPDDPADAADGEGGGDHGRVTEQRLVGKGRHDFGEQAESRQHEEVHLGVTPDPEQVDVQHEVAAIARREEVGAEVTVDAQHGEGNSDDGEDGEANDVGGQRGPAIHRHAEPAHARGAHLHDRRDHVDGVERGAQRGELEGPHPVIDADAGVEGHFREGHEAHPGGVGELTHEERDHAKRGARHGEPKAGGVEVGEGHVPRADLQRDDDVA